MLLTDFKSAYLPTPRVRGSDPSWLEGIANGRPAFILGGAGGLVESTGLQAAQHEIVIGTNWTLRALVPTIWHVVDSAVWKSDRGLVDKCSVDMVIVANKGIFGGGLYSSVGSKQLRMVGVRNRRIAEITIAPVHGGVRAKNGQIKKPLVEPYMPASFTKPFHPGGNSACFTIQTAHLMGCNPIYLLGFTLQSGTGYFFGRTNPVTRRSALYDQERALSWLTWYRQANPGRAKLWPGWSGPIYDVLEVADEAELRSRHKPNPNVGDAVAVE